ncbi:pentapeptide repeat-containing protein [Mesorhizobium sp. M0030]|uniref:pentapeptide repeat-containing protein n=1 Tax=Mesorhizobium sp. M0030 TaxID=2956851 RepID=UPI003339587E
MDPPGRGADAGRQGEEVGVAGMEIHDRSDVLDVRNAIVSNSRFDDVNLSNTQFHKVDLSAAVVEDANLSDAFFSNVNMSNLKIENAEVAGMMINGIRLSDLFQAYETAQTARGN